MLVSLAWIQEFTEVDSSIEELVELVGSRLVEVEEVIDWGKKFKGVIVGEISEVKTHDNADKLNVYQVKTGDDTYKQIVSGDKTLHVGDKVGLIPPGAAVPSTVGTSQPLVIQEMSMRGVISQGMLGSGRELCINDDHSKVLVLDTDALAGTSFAEAYNLNDIVLEIENKSFTHRPDCFGILGVAREIAAIQGKQFNSPDWFKTDIIQVKKGAGNLPLIVENHIPELCPRFTAITLQNITIGPSSLMMQSMLTRMGVRPINNVVDITNYLMLLTGQPMHAYDYDKVRALDPSGEGPTINVRFPHKDEKITLLDGRTITPREEAMMVAAGDKLICVGGAIGGSETEVSETTKNIILECANWDMYSIRRTSMTHGIFTEAVTRYAKGQSPSMCAPVLGHALGMIIETSDQATIASELIDIYPSPKTAPSIQSNSGWINFFLGLSLDTPMMVQILKNIECTVVADAGDMQVTPPLWRTDLHIREDIADEVGRLYGFDKIEPTTPSRDFQPAMPHPMERLKQTSRQFMADAGATEVLTYSFVSDNLMQQTNQESEMAYHLANSLSPEVAFVRTNLLGSLLSKVHANHKEGYEKFALFEMNRTHHKKEEDQAGLPKEYQALAFVYSAEPKAYDLKTLGSPYYQVKFYLEQLFAQLTIKDTHYRLMRPHTIDSIPVWLRMRIGMFDMGRSAIVMKDETMLGVIGEPSQMTRRKLKLPQAVAMFELNLEEMQKAQGRKLEYEPLSKFPGLTQDICFKVSDELLYDDLVMAITDFLRHQKDITHAITPVDIFQRDDQPESKQITIRIKMQHHLRTLTTAEVNQLLDHLATHMASALRAQRV